MFLLALPLLLAMGPGTRATAMAMADPVRLIRRVVIMAAPLTTTMVRPLVRRPTAPHLTMAEDILGIRIPIIIIADPQGVSLPFRLKTDCG